MALRRVIAGIFATMALVSVSCAAPAQERLTLVTGEGYPPFADPGLPDGGVATLLVRQVLEGLGASVQIDFLPWRRGYEETLRGRFDATFPYVRTPEREADFLYSTPLINVRQVVFAAAARPVQYRQPGDLRGLRLCLALGYAPPQALQAMIGANQIERFTPASAETCPALVDSGRADFFVQDQRIGMALVARAGLTGRVMVVPGPPVGETELHLIVPRTRPDAISLMARFDAALARLRASGGYERLLTQ